MTTKKIALDNTEAEENMIDVDVWLRRQEELRIKAIAGRNDIQASLNEPFPKEVERQLKKGGTSLTYIPVSEVISRLNKVLGFDGWAYEIIKCERDALDPEFIVAHVRLSVLSKDDFTNVVKDGFGGQKIKRTKAGDIVDLGDEFKGAVSDALKKAAQALGVGLYLARSEEAMEIEAVAEPTIDPVIEELWTNFVSVSKSLTPEHKTRLGTFWEKYSNGRPKPTKATASQEDLTALLEHCLVLSFDATVREDIVNV
jgi:recombination DNA repair RAD52 pathway protein